MIELSLAEQRGKLAGKDKGLVIHGNRFLAHIIFRRLAPAIIDSSIILPADIQKTVSGLVGTAISDLRRSSNELFADSYPATLFKNQKKLAQLAKALLTSNSALPV